MDNLELVHRELEEHNKLKGATRVVGEAVNDMEALFDLQQAHARWSQASVKDMGDALTRLKQAVKDISKGLSKHFEFEERYMAPVFGENVMNALILEHDEIRQKLIECQARIETQTGDLGQEETLEQKAAVESLMGHLVNMIEGHASREEVILRMLERSLQKRNGVMT